MKWRETFKVKQLQDPLSPFLSQMLGKAGQTRERKTGEETGETGETAQPNSTKRP